MKHGVMFSLISIVVSSLIILLFWTANSPRLDQNAEAIETRITIMNNYVDTWDAYLQDATRILIRSSLSNLTGRISAKGPEERYTHEEIRGNLSSCLIYGVANFGMAENESCTTSAANQSLSTLLQNFSSLAKTRMGVDTTFAIGDDFNITDWAPFEVAVTFTVNYTIMDPAFAVWNRSNKYLVVVSVAGLPDPLFEHYAQGRLNPGETSRLIMPYNKTRDLFNQTDVEDVLATQAYYEHLGTGPTYLERLRGVRSGSLDSGQKAGIETLILPSATALDSQYYKNSSFTDYQILDDKNSYPCGNVTFSIQGFTPGNFFLDVDHLARLGFNASNTVFEYTC